MTNQGLIREPEVLTTKSGLEAAKYFFNKYFFSADRIMWR